MFCREQLNTAAWKRSDESDYLSRQEDCPCTAVDLEAPCPSLARFAIAPAIGLASESRVKGLDRYRIIFFAMLDLEFDNMSAHDSFEGAAFGNMEHSQYIGGGSCWLIWCN